MTRELLGFWVERPESQATEQLIVEWWLLEHAIQRSVDAVRPVLKELLEKDFITKRQNADGRVSYMLNRDKEAEARAWLESRTGEPAE